MKNNIEVFIIINNIYKINFIDDEIKNKRSLKRTG